LSRRPVISDNRSSQQQFNEGRLPAALLADDRSIAKRTMSALGPIADLTAVIDLVR
jgi:hypothetical protein